MWNSGCGWDGPEILMYSLLQIGRSYREHADPPRAAVSRFYVLWRPLPHPESKSGMGKINRKARNFAITCRVQACILWISFDVEAKKYCDLIKPTVAHAEYYKYKIPFSCVFYCWLIWEYCQYLKPNKTTHKLKICHSHHYCGIKFVCICM